MLEFLKKWVFSLRTIIVLLIIILSIVPTVIVSWALIDSVKSKEVENAGSDMQSQILILSNQLQNGKYIENYPNIELDKAIDQMADAIGGRIQIMNSSCQVVYDTYNVDTGNYNISEYVLNTLSGETSNNTAIVDMIASVAQPIVSDTEQELVLENDDTNEEPQYRDKIMGVILATADMTGRTSAVDHVKDQMHLVWIAVAIVVFICAVLAVTWLFKPFKKMPMEINDAFDKGNENIDVYTFSETAAISDAVNKTLSKVRRLDRSRREFVSNVSHELKTPITSMRVLADSINSMGEVPSEMYAEFMNDISNELEREGNIIDDLLSIARLEEGTMGLSCERVNLNEWLEKVLKRIGPIAVKAGVEVLFESIRQVDADIDETKLTLAVTNIVENAIKYNKEGGSVKVSLDADHYYFFIKVSDTGCGIAEEDIPHLFERFYRVDKARSRETGGTGLGLPISKQLISMHGGTIEVTSIPDEGTVFDIKIPLEYKEEAMG